MTRTVRGEKMTAPPVSHPIARRAALLCHDPVFQRFAATRSGFPGGQFSATACAEYQRACCRVASRREFDTTPTAADRFAALRTDFDAWAGRIAAPR